MRRYLCCLLMVMGLASSCSKPIPPYTELLAQTEQAPYRTVIDQKPYRVSMSYRPPWLLAERELHGNEKPDLEGVRQALAAHDHTASFLLKIEPHPDLPARERVMADIVNFQPDQDHHSAVIHHLLFGLNDKIFIQTSSNRKIPVGYYQLQRNMGIGFNNYLLINFPLETDGIALAQEKGFEVVVQNLTPALAELRFAFEANPIGNFSPQMLMASLTEKR